MIILIFIINIKIIENNWFILLKSIDELIYIVV